MTSAPALTQATRGLIQWLKLTLLIPRIRLPPEKPQESFYLPTPTTPEEAFKAIGRLRRAARDEIDRLIQFLDQTDNHMEREEAVDDVPCDDNELDGSSVDGEGEDDEPSLGTVEVHLDLGPGYACTQFFDQSKSQGSSRDDCEGDEHDGREPGGDDEPSLCGINADCRSCDDHDYEADLGSFDRMIDQTKSTLTWGSFYAAEGGEVDPTL